MVSPALEQLARDLAGKVKLVKVNVDTSPQISQRFGAQAIPTLLVLRGGQVTARQTGAAPLAALRTWAETRSPPLAEHRHSPSALPGYGARSMLAAAWVALCLPTEAEWALGRHPVLRCAPPIADSVRPVEGGFRPGCAAQNCHPSGNLCQERGWCGPVTCGGRRAG